MIGHKGASEIPLSRYLHVASIPAMACDSKANFAKSDGWKALIDDRYVIPRFASFDIAEPKIA